MQVDSNVDFLRRKPKKAMMLQDEIFVRLSNTVHEMQIVVEYTISR